MLFKLQVVNDVQKEKLKDARHLLFCLENGCEVCFLDGGVKYESDTDISESNNETDDDQEVEIEID